MMYILTHILILTLIIFLLYLINIFKSDKIKQKLQIFSEITVLILLLKVIIGILIKLIVIQIIM
jgi:hypothetical protein